MTLSTVSGAPRRALVLFPHQLFERKPLRPPADRVYLVEHPLFFTQYPFHKQKLILHRASMTAFADRLSATGVMVRHVRVEEFRSAGASSRRLGFPPPLMDGGMGEGDNRDERNASSFLGGGVMERTARLLQMDGCTEVLVFDLDDDWLERDVRTAFRGMPVRTLDSPMFVTDLRTLGGWFAGRKVHRMGDFYAFQRRRPGILLDERGRPIGGKWSFDAENRKRLPKDVKPPDVPSFGACEHVAQAVRWVEETFPENYGASSGFSYPTAHEEARRALRSFLEDRLALFGDYEDAMAMDHATLFHSVLTPAMNIGLLTPSEVIAETLAHASEHRVPLNALEGFIRQVIGWREFVRGLYHAHGRRQRTMNCVGFTNLLPEAFWTGTTGLVPADTVIRRVLRTGYCHHIERLMVLGSLMLLCELSPDAVYEWFMTLFIDAYDWVMVPNVYGMSQYADGGIMATKLYISGSAYLRRMGDWPGGDWERIWDGLCWRFVDRHRDVFHANPAHEHCAPGFRSYGVGR